MAIADTLTAALQSILGSRPTAADRRALAELLITQAQRQRDIAQAEERGGVRMLALAKREIAQANQTTGRPRGSGARFVRFSASRIKKPNGTTETKWRGFIAPALYEEFGSPPRVLPTRNNTSVVICASNSDQSLGVTTTGGTPRFSIGATRISHLGVAAGTYDAEINGSAIVLHLK